MSRSGQARRGKLVAIMAGALIVLSAAPAFAAIKMTAVYYDPYRGPDPDTNAGRNLEYVVIRNSGTHSRAITGWTLRDLARPGVPAHVYTFPSYSLGAGRSVKIHTGIGSNTSSDLYWGSRVYIWGDDSDTATLKNGTTTADTCSWGTADSSPKFC